MVLVKMMVVRYKQNSIVNSIFNTRLTKLTKITASPSHTSHKGITCNHLEVKNSPLSIMLKTKCPDKYGKQAALSFSLLIRLLNTDPDL